MGIANVSATEPFAGSPHSPGEHSWFVGLAFAVGLVLVGLVAISLGPFAAPLSHGIRTADCGGVNYCNNQTYGNVSPLQPPVAPPTGSPSVISPWATLTILATVVVGAFAVLLALSRPSKPKSPQLATYCPADGTPRVPNGTYCNTCGRSFAK
jgi:hypothetical protein